MKGRGKWNARDKESKRGVKREMVEKRCLLRPKTQEWDEGEGEGEGELSVTEC